MVNIVAHESAEVSIERIGLVGFLPEFLAHIVHVLFRKVRKAVASLHHREALAGLVIAGKIINISL